MEFRAEHIVYYILSDIPDSLIKEEDLDSFIYDITPEMQNGNYSLPYAIARKILASRIIYKKLSDLKTDVTRDLAVFVDICIDCLLYTPPEFFYLTRPAQSSIYVILGLRELKIFDDIIIEKVSPFLDDVITNPNLLMSIHHRNLVKIFFNYSDKFTMAYKSQLVSLLQILFNDTLDYKLLSEYIEFFVDINLVVKNCRKKEVPFLLFEVNDERSHSWEILWNSHIEELLYQLAKFISIDILKSHAHPLNINLIILVTLLRCGQNVGFVEICLEICKHLFIVILHVITKIIESNNRYGSILHFFNLVLLFIDVFVKIAGSNYYVLFVNITEILSKIYPYGFQINNYILLTNCLSVFEAVYDCIMAIDKNYAEDLIERSKTVILDCVKSLQTIKNILTSKNTHLLVIEEHCLCIMSFLQEREKYLSKLFRILTIHVVSNTLIESIILPIIELANNLIMFIHFCDKWVNLTKENNNCLRAISSSISMLLSSILKRDLLPQYFNDISMTEFIPLFKEFYIGLSFRYKFDDKSKINGYQEYSDIINCEFNGKNQNKNFNEVEITHPINAKGIFDHVKELESLIGCFSALNPS